MSDTSLIQLCAFSGILPIDTHLFDRVTGQLQHKYKPDHLLKQQQPAYVFLKIYIVGNDVPSFYEDANASRLLSQKIPAFDTSRDFEPLFQHLLCEPMEE